MFAILITFNEARTDYLLRGPYLSHDCAIRALNRYCTIFKSARSLEIASIEISERDRLDSHA